MSVTLVVLVLGSAGMYASRERQGGALRSYADSLWFTAMILTTLGSDFWPASGAGRALAFLLALYAFAVFGYLTATLASFFIGRDAEDREGEVTGSTELREIRAEIAALRRETALARSQDPDAADKAWPGRRGLARLGPLRFGDERQRHLSSVLPFGTPKPPARDCVGLVLQS